MGAEQTTATGSSLVTSTFEVRVAERDDVADGVVALEFEHPQGDDLPAWSPGAHVDVVLGQGMVRQYSLCGDPDERKRWRIAILRERYGRGGSAYVHDNLASDAIVTVSEPRNHFELAPASHYVFIAGGIGITPILAMIRSRDVQGADWQLHYGGRTRASMAFTHELTAAFGDRVRICPQDEVGLLDLPRILAQPDSDTLIYCCGPGPLLDAVEGRCHGWPTGSLRVERFQPKEQAELTQYGSFEVELARSGTTVAVAAGQSVLDAVRAAGVAVASSCEEGTCGTCEVAVLDGEVDHRDSILSPDEQAADDAMLICVSRARCPRLVLDL